MPIDPDDYDLRELRRIADERRGARRADDDYAAEERSRDAARPSAERRRDRTERRRPSERRDDFRRRSGRQSESRQSDSHQSDSHQSDSHGSDRTRDRSDARRRNGRTSDRPRDRDVGDVSRQSDEREHAGGRDTDGDADDDSDRGSDGDDRDSRSSAGRSAERRGRRRSERRRVADRGGRTADHSDEVSVRPREGVSRPRRGDSDHARGHDEVVLADQIARDLGFGERSREEFRRGRDSRPRRDARGRTDSLSRPPAETGLESADDVGQFQFDTEIRERPRGRAGEALRKNQLEQLLVHETAASEGLSKPYLGSLPDAYAAERLVFDWLEFLVLKGGFKRTMDALRYYHTVEWLTEDVESELQDYLVGFSGEVSETTEYDVDDHHLSLVYIARLASMT
ncbi:flagellar protein d/e [Halobellus sp. Atlit-31R]|nr:flagellar protein d/e [Halobellus sp. Atlit-31R]